MSDECQRVDIPPPVNFIWAKSSVDGTVRPSEIAVERCGFGLAPRKEKWQLRGSQLPLQSYMTNPGSQC